MINPFAGRSDLKKTRCMEKASIKDTLASVSLIQIIQIVLGKELSLDMWPDIEPDTEQVEQYA